MAREGKLLHPGEVHLPLDAAPPGIRFKRNNHDFVNNFYVDLVAKAFTDVLEQIRQKNEEREASKEIETLESIEGAKKAWMDLLLGTADKEMGAINKVIDKGMEAMRDEPLSESGKNTVSK